MAYFSDLLVAAAALGAALYCFILSRRLQALTRLDGGLGSAIALLSAQVDDLSRTLRQAREGADAGAAALDDRIARAEAACGRLDLLLASLHDLPDESSHAQWAATGTQTQAGMSASSPGAGGSTEASLRKEPNAQQPPRARIVRRRQPLERV